MNKGDYIDGVIQRMNELGWDDTYTGTFAGSDTSKVEKQVEKTFVDAWIKSFEILPRSYYVHKSFIGQQHKFDTIQGTGQVLVPEDFYVLASFKMKGWRRECLTASAQNEHNLNVQSNEYVRGNCYRPFCIRTKGEKDTITYYSLPTGSEHEIEKAIYIALPKSIDDVEIQHPQLIVPLQWVHASVVFTTFEKYEQANAAMSALSNGNSKFKN